MAALTTAPDADGVPESDLDTAAVPEPDIGSEPATDSEFESESGFKSESESGSGSGSGSGVPGPALPALPVQVRASLLARLNHDLRTPLAQIAARAQGAGLDDLADLAHRQLAWLADLHACARYEATAPEVAPAPAYLHALMQAHGVRYNPQSLPGVAVLDARLLAQVLDRVAAHTGAAPMLAVDATGDGTLLLAFSAGDWPGAGTDPDTDSGIHGDRSWTAVPATLDHDDIAPGLVLAAHLVRAMGGCLQQAGAALRFTLTVETASEDQAMPPAPFSARDQPPPPFGDGLTVLVLEPHDAMRDYLTEVFDSAGFALCYDVQELRGAQPALVVCAEAEASEPQTPAYRTAPRLLHALLPPARPQDCMVVLIKPAPAQQLLEAARRLLAHDIATAVGDRR